MKVFKTEVARVVITIKVELRICKTLITLEKFYTVYRVVVNLGSPLWALATAKIKA